MDCDFLKALGRKTCFFDAGIRFACRQCGGCCVGDSGTIYVSRREISAIAAHLDLDPERFIGQYLYPYKDSYSIREDEDGQCLFYDRGCRIYELRPLQCRTWPFWFSNLRSPQHWRSVCRRCPGIGQGRLHSRDDILRAIRRTTHI